MTAGKATRSVLVVSSSANAYKYITQILPSTEFSPITRVGSAGEAKRYLVSAPVDILIINTPLPDDFGLQLALDMADSSMGILLFVKSDLFDQVTYKVEDSGVFTVQKPNSRQTIYGAIKLLAAMTSKLKAMEKKTRTLQEKMADIRVVNRAKWLLIENLKMSESDAHYYIEKHAMDTRLSRREVAESIIRTYDK